MSIPKRQHWVPRFYLRYFKVPTSNTRLEQVWILHRKEGKPALTGIENIAAEKHLYTQKRQDGTRDARLERKLAQLEASLSQLWPELASGFVDLGSDAIRKGIGLFLSVQFLRHPERRESALDFRRRLIDFIRQQPAGSDGLPAVEAIQTGPHVVEFHQDEWQSYLDGGPEFAEQVWRSMIEEEAIRLAKMLMAKRWSMVFIDDPLFVTSDYPLFVASAGLHRWQIGGENAVLMFPVSPTRILCFDDLDAPANQYYHLQNEQADLYNLLTWINTEAFMISSRDIYDVLAGIDRVRREFEDDMLNQNS